MPASLPPEAPRGLFCRLLTPSLLDVFFAALLLGAFAHPGGLRSLLSDGDTGWHIRTGELVLAAGRAPLVDPFSFSRPHEAWFAWEWLADVVFASAWRWRGLGGVATLAGVVLALGATALLARMLRRGAGLWISLAATMAAASASSIHYLARPHVFSILLYTLALWVVCEDLDRRRPLVWLLAPGTALWANLHAGFVAWLATLGLLVMLSVARRDWPQVRRYGCLLALCTLGSLLNPYGWQLHLHIVRYLGSSWIMDNVQEFQSPHIRAEGMVVFALLLLSLFSSAHAPAATDYFIRPKGDDAAKGDSTNAAWRTIARVNRARLQPGDRLLFEAGAAFAGDVLLSAEDAGTSNAPVTIGSFGDGRATILAGQQTGLA